MTAKEDARIGGRGNQRRSVVEQTLISVTRNTPRRFWRDDSLDRRRASLSMVSLRSRSMPASSRRLFLTAAVQALVWGQAHPQQDEAARYWDKVYAAHKPIFLRQPTALVMDAIKDRKPGQALDIGMGQGRNAIFLATRGWDVTGFDPSTEGVRQAETQARRLGIHLHALVAREEDFDLGNAQWDLIVMTYVRRLRSGDAERLSRSLKPQGIFVYENNNAGERNELLRQFLSFRIIRFEDVDAYSDWHPDKKQEVERLIAQKTQN